MDATTSNTQNRETQNVSEEQFLEQQVNELLLELNQDTQDEKFNCQEEVNTLTEEHIISTDYKSQQKTFNIPFDISMFTEIDKNFLKTFNFECTKLTQTEFEHLAQLLLKYEHPYATSKFDIGKIKVELNPLRATVVFKRQRATRLLLQIHERVQPYYTYSTFWHILIL